VADSYPALTKTTTSTTGTNDYVLDVAALGSSHRTPKQAVADGSLSNGDVVLYMARDATVVGDASFEFGEGVYTDGTNTVARLAANVHDSENGPGVLVSWGSGTRDFYLIGIVSPARIDRANSFTEDQTIDKATAILTLTEASAGSDESTFRNTGNTLQIRKDQSSGQTNLTIEPRPLDNTSLALMQLFRNTNTSGGRLINIYKGDGTSTVTCLINTATGDAEFENIEDAAGLPFEHFAAGTKMVFFQASAPTGWTKDVANNDAALRVVSGTGGGTGGSRALSASTVGATTLTISQMPSHNHDADGGNGSTDFSTFNSTGSFAFSTESGSVDIRGEPTTASTGGGTSHDHTLALKHIDVIVCSKD
jgi:hypothetical protein